MKSKLLALLLASFTAAPLWGGVLVMDDFNDNASGNFFAGGEGVLSGTSGIAFVSTTTLGNTGFSRAVVIPNSSADHGYYSARSASVNLSTYKYLSFWIRGLSGGEDVACDFDDNANYPFVRVFSFLPDGLTTSFQKVVVATAAFYNDPGMNWGASAGAFKIQSKSGVTSGGSTVYIDDVRFGTKIAPVWVDNFNDGAGPLNFGNDSNQCYATPGSCGSDYNVSNTSLNYDITNRFGSTGYGYKVAFTNNSNTDSMLLFPLEQTNGTDVSGTDTLSFQIKGDSTAVGKNLGIGLKDSSDRVVSLADYLTGGITTSFQEVRIPVSAFTGLSTTTVKYFELWFQKSGSPLVTQTGNVTAYFDNIQFVDTSSPTAPSALTSNGASVANGTIFFATNTITMTADAASTDPTLEHVGLEYSSDGSTWYRAAVDTATADTAYGFTWNSSSATTGVYQARAFAEDVQGNRGVGAAFTSCRIARSSTTYPSAISNLTGLSGANDGEVSLSWTAPSDDGTSGTVFSYVLKTSSSGVVTSAGFDAAATYSQAWSSLAAPGAAETRMLTGLLPGVTYWLALKAEAINGHFSVWNSSSDSATINTLAKAAAMDNAPSAINSLTAAANSKSSIRLTWTPPSAPSNVNDYVSYKVYRATQSFTALTEGGVELIATVAYSSSATSVAYTDLSALVTTSVYYYAVVTVDDAPNVLTSAFSNLVSATTQDFVGRSNELTITHTPLTEVNVLGQSVVLSAVVQSTRTLSTVYLYYRKTGDSAYTTASLSPAVSGYRWEGTFTIPAAAVTTAGLEYYFIADDGVNVTTSGTSNAPYRVTVNAGAASPVISSGTVTLYDGNQSDGETSITLPEGALPGPTALTIAREDVLRVPSAGQLGGIQPVEAYRYGPDGLRFLKPATLTLRFVDLDPRDGKVDGTGVSAASLRVFWHDGYLWRPAGGKVDTARNTVSAPVSHFSLYGLFPASLSPNDSRPQERIITPNGDGRNDVAIFDNMPSEFTIKIYDLKGRPVRELHNVGYWDGRDNAGDVVQNGVYIYQSRVNTENISGTIAVAR